MIYHTFSPKYVSNGFSTRSAFFMSNIANLVNFNDEFISSYLKQHRLGKFGRIQKGNVQCLWITSTGNKELYLAFSCPSINNYQLVNFPIKGRDANVSIVVAEMWNQIARDVMEWVNMIQPEQLCMTGYSEGGALATLAAYSIGIMSNIFEPVLYTFGSRKVGDVGFATHLKDFVKECYHVIIPGDAGADGRPNLKHSRYQVMVTEIQCVITQQEQTRQGGSARRLTDYIVVLEKLFKNGIKPQLI